MAISYLEFDVPLWLARAIADMKDDMSESVKVRDPIPSLVHNFVTMGVLHISYYAGSNGDSGGYIQLTPFGKEYAGLGMRKGICFVRVLLGADECEEQ